MLDYMWKTAMMKLVILLLHSCNVVKDVFRAGRNYEYDSAEDEDGLPKLSVILQTVLDLGIKSAGCICRKF